MIGWKCLRRIPGTAVDRGTGEVYIMKNFMICFA
jgi:hypothetical protein